MRQYGHQRTLHKVAGHSHAGRRNGKRFECGICYPATDTKVGRSKARRGWRRAVLPLLLALSACSAPPGPPPVVWDMVEDPELLQDAASLLCDATDGEHCPATIESGGTRHVTFSDSLQDCGRCEWHGRWIELRTEACPAQTGGGDAWGDATPREALVLTLAHELGHTLWGPGHDDRPGALMGVTVQYRMPLLVPGGE